MFDVKIFLRNLNLTNCPVTFVTQIDFNFSFSSLLLLGMYILEPPQPLCKLELWGTAHWMVLLSSNPATVETIKFEVQTSKWRGIA